MKRRSAIKGLSAIAIGISLFPSCSDGLKLDIESEDGIVFNPQQNIWIETISDAILPKEGEQLTTFESFPAFVSKMISFEKSDEDQNVFIKGYNSCTADIKEMFDSNTTNVSPEQIIEYFENILNNKEKDIISEPTAAMEVANKTVFCKELRSLSIRHLSSSKEYQEGVLEYQLVPGFYNACIPV